MSTNLLELAKEKKLLWHLVAIAILVLANVIYFYPQLEGKKLNQEDLISSTSKNIEWKEYTTEEKDFFLWTNSQFGGMPRMLFAPVQNNIVIPIYKLMTLGFNSPIGIFNVMMIGLYLLFLTLGLHPLGAVLFALATGFSVNNLVLWDAGHASKVRTLAMLPFISSGILLLYEKHKFYLGGALLALGLTLCVYMQHSQMIYYSFLVFLIYGGIKLITAIQRSKLQPFLISTGIVVLAALLSLAASAPRIMSVYEYNKSSMRGEPILEIPDSKPETAKSSSEVEGLDWGYAMQWSNGWIDLIATFIPGAAGGSGSEKVGPDSATYQNFRIQEAPLYWGALPFTSGPIYLGAVLLFLFVFGLFYLKGPLKWWLGLGVLLTYMLSMGSHLDWFNKPLFDYLPLYNKFRTPQSVLSVTVFFLPILGGLALHQLIKNRPKAQKKKKKVSRDSHFSKSLLWSVGICGGLALIYALFGTAFHNFEGAGDQRYLQQGVDIQPFVEDRIALMRGDAWRSFFFVAITALVLWLFQQRRLQSAVLMVGLIGGFAMVDNWSVSKRYLDHDDFVSPRAHEQNFEPRPVDQEIMAREENRYDYRVLDLSINTFNSSFTSTFHNHIGGYHPAKLQRYQDVIDHHISRNNQQVLNMLNTKYIIQGGQGDGETYQVNPGALGNAWCVNELVEVSSPREEIDALNTIDPGQQAVILTEDFPWFQADQSLSEGGNCRVDLVEYDPENLTYSFSAQEDQLVVFSEIWYGPDKGWQAYIDGEPVDHLRANYILRALPVPAGEHEIRFEFRPQVYYNGETIALIASSLLLMSIIGGFFVELRKTL